jgi:hypothetical protein
MRAQVLPVLVGTAVMLAVSISYSQSPAPIVVQAAPAVTKGVQPPAAVNDSTATNLKTLLQLKTANEEILKKQEATLQALDELQKAADQIKVFSKRT